MFLCGWCDASRVQAYCRTDGWRMLRFLPLQEVLCLNSIFTRFFSSAKGLHNKLRCLNYPLNTIAPSACHQPYDNNKNILIRSTDVSSAHLRLSLVMMCCLPEAQHHYVAVALIQSGTQKVNRDAPPTNGRHQLQAAALPDSWRSCCN